MSRVAPNLLYLTIYNPTLRPSGPVVPDDEDAEEQAHILFYTSKERAVSRDRMLRQVGLAKALISFSDMFNAEDPCNNVHSQTKRMIMVSPEPDFWIHAGIEVAKTPRPPAADKAKGKGKDKAKAEQPLLYDYHEHSVHDVAVQEDILRAYDKFKLRHGSFASILASLGQEALELQLERFFTVWAWSWNLEDGPEFGEHLGPPIHPLHSALLPSLDDFSSRLPDEVVAIAISPPYVIPSTRYTAASYPSALPSFLLSLLPPPQPLDVTTPTTSDDRTLRAPTTKPPLPAWPPKDLPAEPKPEPSEPANGHNHKPSSSFLGLPIDVKMDMPKWNVNWLTFGKNTKKAPELFAVTPFNENKGAPAEASSSNGNGNRKDGEGVKRQRLPMDTPNFERTMSTLTSDFEVDRGALEDAMHEERVNPVSAVPMPDLGLGAVAEETSTPTVAAGDGHSLSETIVPGKGGDEADEAEAAPKPSVLAVDFVGVPPPEESMPVTAENSLKAPPDVHLERSLPPTPEPESDLEPAEFASTTIHLARADDPQATQRRRLFYLVRERVLVALLGIDDASEPVELAPLAAEASDLATTLLAAASEDLSKSIDTLPSATKILQPKDRYALSSAGLALRSPDFTSRSGHLYDARQLLRSSDPAISEVFSRGQNPQHWHVARRLPVDTNGRQQEREREEEVYMEVFRKEASLTDVDNALAGVVRKSGIQIGAGAGAGGGGGGQ
ncbi:hypothetical protein B0H16DRAFT_1816894 [Mycena metata]|uniref:CCZ1/INTU/HSP4 first Longin domain-containing protein n=1 Tax=Mycena metata TaxID=1033252 RepID=A0AAD7H3G2_9AGAR|nr:hypothetical protein B0H16DRAFT_1816894 [Mycena metata]